MSQLKRFNDLERLRIEWKQDLIKQAEYIEHAQKNLHSTMDFVKLLCDKLKVQNGIIADMELRLKILEKQKLNERF